MKKEATLYINVPHLTLFAVNMCLHASDISILNNNNKAFYFCFVSEYLLLAMINEYAAPA